MGLRQDRPGEDFCGRIHSHDLREDTRERAPVCRWVTPDGDIVDVMPIIGDVLSFANPWYAEAIATATSYRLDTDVSILGALPDARSILALIFRTMERLRRIAKT
jgi:hypothetical protein